MSSIHHAWLEEHRNYAHSAWCLLWPFGRDTFTGRAAATGFDGKSGYAPRMMCGMIHGPAPADRPQAMHSCGNGHLGCVNPNHLSWGNNSENQRTRYAQGRGNPHANGNRSRFTPEQIAEMKSLYGQMTQWEIARRFECSLGLVQYYLKYQNERGHAGQKIKHWSPDECAELARLLDDGKTHDEIAAMIGRPRESVSAKASRLKLKSRRGSGGRLLPLAS